MTRLFKLIERLKSRPKDFSWSELATLLDRFGFTETQGNGSRVKFYHERLNCMIQLHKPHPSPILKHYVVKEVIEILTREQLI